MAEQTRRVGARAVMPGSLIDLVPVSAGRKEPQTPMDLLKAGSMVLMIPKEGCLAASWAL